MTTISSRRSVASRTLAMLGGAMLFMSAITADAVQPVGRHVVLVVMDGLRPDSVTETDMPVLFKLGQDGVRFADHHCAYLSSTEVNGTALATGSYPRRSGIMANHEYRPLINLSKPVAMEEVQVVRKGDSAMHGHYLAMPTMPELLQRHGLHTVVAGTKGVALLLDRTPPADDSTASPVLYEGQTLPEHLANSLAGSRGTMPVTANATIGPNSAADLWTTKAVLNDLWAKEVPALTVLWLSEPDYAQHGSGPQSPVARLALRSSDDNLGRVLQTLDERHLRDNTDVLVVSDHGFSTIGRTVETIELLNNAGFRACKKFKDAPTAGEVLVVSNGGSLCIYVVRPRQADRSAADRIFSDERFRRRLVFAIRNRGHFSARGRPNRHARCAGHRRRTALDGSTEPFRHARSNRFRRKETGRGAREPCEPQSLTKCIIL